MTPKYSLPDVGNLLQAAVFAAQKHAGQIRKDENHSPYITHPLLVAQLLWEVGQVQDELTLTAAILHDTVEDTDTTPEEIEAQFGADVRKVVMDVTDDKSLPKMERKRQQVVHAAIISHEAKTLKLADKIVNCRDILNVPPADWPVTRRQNYIQWAADVLAAGLRGANPALEALFDQIAAEAEEKLNFTIQPFETIHTRPWAP